MKQSLDDSHFFLVALEAYLIGTTYLLYNRRDITI
jgi:hypothetical protein